MNIIAFIIAIIFMVVGFLGVIIPGLPDAILILAGALVYAIWTKFAEVNINLILILAGLTALSLILDYLGAALGAKKFGASKLGVFGAILGGILGFIIFSFLGLILGAILGTVVFEIIFTRKDWSLALKAGFGTFLGLIFGIFLKIIIAILMIGLFLGAVF